MNYAATKLIAGYASISAGAIAAAYLLACELGDQPTVVLHSNLFG
jgi:hypothetical protein